MKTSNRRPSRNPAGSVVVGPGPGSAPGGLAAVLEAIARTAARLCDAHDALIFRVDGNQLRLVAKHGRYRTWRAVGDTYPLRRDDVPGRAALEQRTIHVRDLAVAARTRFSYDQAALEATGTRTLVATPLALGDRAVGVIVIRRRTVRPFTPKQVALLRTFADQAAIAIENARLSEALEARNRELTDALERETAAAGILRIISSSPGEMRRVFDMIAANAVRLCDGQFGGVFQFDGERVHLLAQHGLTPEGMEVYAETFPRPAARDSAIGRAMLDRAVAHIPDVRADPAYGLTALAQAGTMRCIVAVPVLRKGDPIGGVVAWRSRPEPFSDAQIELLKTFADQALIAIEN
ncbi:MAG: GAF domain-containing protein, partial [Candidatus Rokuibacteriota bacterium]